MGATNGSEDPDDWLYFTLLWSLILIVAGIRTGWYSDHPILKVVLTLGLIVVVAFVEVLLLALGASRRAQRIWLAATNLLCGLVVLGAWRGWLGIDSAMELAGALVVVLLAVTLLRSMTVRRFVALLVVAAILAIAFPQYRAAVGREFAAGQAAHRSGDCRRAVEHYDVVMAYMYRLSFSRAIDLAARDKPECELIISADLAKSKREYSKAVSLYQSYEKRYPRGVLLPLARSGAARTYGEWAADLARNGRYLDAVEHYQEILESYTDTATASVARVAIFETYKAAVRPLRRRAYCDAISILAEFARASSLTVGEARRIVTKAKAALPGTLIGCGMAQAKERKYNEAMRTFARVIRNYPRSPLASRARAGAARALYLRGVTEYGDRDYKAAIRTFTRMMRAYPDSSSLPQARTALQTARSALQREEEATRKRRITDRIADIRREGAGELPPPQAVGGAPSGSVVITITNDSPRALELLLGGPTTRAANIRACRSCEIYGLVDALVNPPCRSSRSERLPSITLTLKPGAYHAVVLAKHDPTITPFYGRWRFRGGTRYSSCLYIARSP